MFLLGLFLGVVLGYTLCCLMVVSKKSDEKMHEIMNKK